MNIAYWVVRSLCRSMVIGIGFAMGILCGQGNYESALLLVPPLCLVLALGVYCDYRIKVSTPR